MDNHQHRGLAVIQAGILHVFNGIADLRDIRELDALAIAIGDDQAPVLRRERGLVVGVNLIALRADIKIPFGRIRIRRGQCGAHILKPDTVFIQRPRLQLHAHGGQRRPPSSTLPTPLTWLNCCSSTVSAES